MNADIFDVPSHGIDRIISKLKHVLQDSHKFMHNRITQDRFLKRDLTTEA